MLDVKEKCTGCGLCKLICPTKAITYTTKNGFRYPQIDESKCVKCGLCEKKCPVFNAENSNNSYPAVYAAWINDEIIRYKCTSGGICYALSYYILKSGGCVAGVVWNEDFTNASYKLVDSLDDIEKITGTKYFQPEMNDIYLDVKKALEAGKQVLYIGTSCTGASLRSFLGKDYNTLYIVDFICRGYTSQTYQEKRVKYLEKKHNSKLRKLQFKNKKNGWSKFGTLFEFENGDAEFFGRDEDPYELLFRSCDYNTRPSCFQCKYRSLPRLSDITVGDFWGISNIEDKHLDAGVSAVLCNSYKGAGLIEGIKDAVTFQERSIDEIKKGNKCLLGQLVSKDGASEFFSDLENINIHKLHKKYINRYFMKKKARHVLQMIRTARKVNFLAFIYFNFFCNRVERSKHKYIIPYYGSRIEIKKGGKILINGNFFLNDFKHKHSHEESYLTVKKGILEINGKCRIATQNTLTVNDNARMVLDGLETNSGTAIVCSNEIIIGEGSMIGRNATIYDSSFHKTKFGEKKGGKPLIIGKHVWICSDAKIVKGLKIGDGSICGMGAVVTTNVKPACMVLGNPAKTIMNDVFWEN